jgi:DNA-nicking Smr family endonuclease
MINDEDRQLFRDEIDNIAPVDKDGVRAEDKIKQARFTQYSLVLEANLKGAEVVNFAQNISPKIIKKMQRGDIDYAPTLDLHGQTTFEACESMSEFMYHHQHDKFLRIIHGKGYRSEHQMSILKTQVVSFLRQHPQVLAFHSCPEKDGGSGAVFILLKHT